MQHRSAALEVEKQAGRDLEQRLEVVEDGKRAAEEAAAAGKASAAAAAQQAATQAEAHEVEFLELQAALAAQTQHAGELEARVAELSTQLVEVSKSGTARSAEADEVLEAAEGRAASAESAVVQLRLEKAEQRTAREAAETLAARRNEQLTKLTNEVAALSAQVGSTKDLDAARRYATAAAAPINHFLSHPRASQLSAKTELSLLSGLFDRLVALN